MSHESKELTCSSLKEFLSVLLSGAMEPLPAGLALVMAQFHTDIDPWALAFSGVMMLSVNVEELVPEVMSGTHLRLGVWTMIIGFVLMTIGEQLVKSQFRVRCHFMVVAENGVSFVIEC
jgi:zinc transporter ZupT